MKILIVAVLFVGLALARPQGGEQQQQQQADPNAVQVLRYESDNSGVGGYRFAYETSDGTSRQEQGDLKNEGEENAALEVKGSYSWTAPNGETFTVTFTADENGYHPEASHIPKTA